jgi:hypothetical protein
MFLRKLNEFFSLGYSEYCMYEIYQVSFYASRFKSTKQMLCTKFVLTLRTYSTNVCTLRQVVDCVHSAGIQSVTRLYSYIVC